MKNSQAIREEIAKINASLNVIAQLLEGKNGYTKHFSYAELDNGNAPTEEQYWNLHELATQLEVIRSAVNRPVQVSSALRSIEQNKKADGAPNSQHLHGRAADIKVEGYTSSELKQLIETLIDAGKIKQGGLSAYANHVHYDIRGTKARW